MVELRLCLDCGTVTVLKTGCIVTSIDVCAELKTEQQAFCVMTTATIPCQPSFVVPWTHQVACTLYVAFQAGMIVLILAFTWSEQGFHAKQQ